MPVYKCTALLRQLTGIATQSQSLPNRLAGWSESWYFDGTLAAAKSKFYDGGESWCRYRAALLPARGSITEQRIQAVSPAGGTFISQTLFPASTTLATDAPQVAILCAYISGDGLNTRNWAIRDLPDARQEYGEYSGSGAFNLALLNFNDFIVNNFSIRCVNHAFVKSNIISIDANGLVKTKQAHDLVAGNEVAISRTINSITTRSNSFLHTVATAPTPTTFTTQEGFGGVPYTKGTARHYAIGFQSVSAWRQERTVTRKVGRPSEEYRGRVSARRR